MPCVPKNCSNLPICKIAPNSLQKGEKNKNALFFQKNAVSVQRGKLEFISTYCTYKNKSKISDEFLLVF